MQTVSIIDKEFKVWGTCETGTRKMDEFIQYMTKMNHPESFWLIWIENNQIHGKMTLLHYIKIKGL